MNWKKGIKRTGKWAAVTVAALLLLGILLFALVQTGPGRQRVARLIVSALSAEEKMQVRMGRLGGLIPFRVTVDHMAFQDPHGEWMNLQGVVLRWSPAALLRGWLHFLDFRVRILELRRPPRSEVGSGKSAAAAFTWPATLPRFRLDGFAVEQLILGEEGFRERILFRLEGDVTGDPSGDGMAASLKLERKGGPGMRAGLKAVFKEQGHFLSLDLQFEEALGGVVAGVFGTGGPLSLSLQGEGPVETWKGKLRADGGGLGRLESDIGLVLGAHGLLRAGGTLSPDKGLLPAALRPWLGPEIRFDLDLGRLEDGSVEVGTAVLRSGDLLLELGGTLNLREDRSRGRFRLVCRDMVPLGSLTGVEWGGEASVNGRFLGPVFRPHVIVDAELRRVLADRILLGALLAHIELDFPGDLGPSFPGVRVKARGDIQDLALRDGGPLPERTLSWVLEAEGPLQEAIRISRLEVTGERISGRFSGRVHTKGPSVEGEGALDIRDLRPVGEFAGLDLAGRTRMKASMEGNAGERSLSVRFQGRYTVPDRVDPLLDTLLGQGLDYAGSLGLSGNRELRISDMMIRATAGSLTGEALLDLEKQDIQGSWRLEIPSLAIFSTPAKRALAGSLTVQGRAAGAAGTMELAAEIAGQGVRVDEIPLDGLKVKLEGRRGAARSQGRLSVDVAPSGLQVKGMTDFAFEGNLLALTSLSLTGPESVLTGNLSLDIQSLLTRGELKGGSSNLSVFSRLLGAEIGGNLKVRTGLEVVDGGQTATVAAEGRDLTGPFGRAGKGVLYGSVRDAFGAPRGTATLELSEIRRDDLILENLVLGVEGDKNRMDFRGGTRGRFREALEMDVSGMLDLSSRGGRIELKTLRATYGGLPLILTRPVIINGADERIRFEGLALTLGPGTLAGSGSLGRNGIGVDLEFVSIPLDAARPAGVPDLTGRASGKLQVTGSPDRPEGRAAIQIEGFRFLDPQFQDIPPATVEGLAELSPGKLHGRVLLKGLTVKPFEANLDIPLRLSLSPPAWSLGPGGEIAGSLTGDMDLKRMVSFLGLDAQTLEGEMSVDLALAGTVNAPLIRGGARVINGSYENNRSGTVLRDIIMEIEAGTPRLKILRAEANDGGGGKISAKGWMDVLPEQGFPFEVGLFLEQATLLRGDDANATLGGQLLVSGSTKEVLVKGAITLETAEFRIPERLPPDIVDLEVMETGGPGGEKPLKEKGPEGETPIELDLTLKSPGRAFVRGRGLDSEWRGEIRVLGKGREPVVTGGLSVVRGSFDFLGKRFGLKRGEIILDGLVPPSPRLDVQAEASGKEMTAFLRLSGPAKSPEIILSSDPSLPSDEILSRLLFGRNVSQITPVQAIQLASAVNVLAGGGGDLMGRTRQWLGIDSLDVKQSGQGVTGTTIRAGKYVRDDVYLEVEEGIGPEAGKASVQWELTPNITVETEAGANAEGGVGVKWKWDY